jgi:peroxiredoxin
MFDRAGKFPTQTNRNRRRNYTSELGHEWGLDSGVAKKYGAYRDGEGICERALYVIDDKGKIAWSYCSPISVNPGADGILEALEGLSIS